MINILDIKSSILTPGSIIADLYDISHQGYTHLIGRTSITPYREEMKKDVNNIILFLDSDNNITGGQIGKYNWNNGLHIVEFVEN